MVEFTPLSFQISNIGQRIKSSKKNITWEFLLNDTFHRVTVFYSAWSKKIRILLNNELIITTKNSDGFRYALEVPSAKGLLTISHGNFDLFINQISFADLHFRRTKVRKLTFLHPASTQRPLYLAS